MNYIIEKLNDLEKAPYELLLLADPSRDAIDEYLNRGECYILTGNEQIGVYVLIKTRPQTLELVNVAVKASHQGKGIGRKLVMHAIETAKQNGCKTLEVGTGNSSVGQLALYQKCGFRMSSIDKDFFIRHYDEEIFENGIQCRDMVRLSLDF